LSIIFKFQINKSLNRTYCSVLINGIIAKYPLTPAFRLGIKKAIEFGFSHEFIRISNQIVMAKAKKMPNI
jgi:hypothetical protein